MVECWHARIQRVDDMRESRKFCQGEGGSNCFLSFFTFFKLFSLIWGEGIQIPLKAGHQRPASERH